MELIGRVLGGRYRIVRGIGAGGMGGVYEAVQEGLGRRVAIKVIAEQLASEPVYLERFRREALSAAQLGHPNLVTVTDFQHVPGEPPFLVMELLEGEPLNKRLSRGPLDPALAVDVTLQVLAGLEVAHAQGIVHRDLKPGNVFLVPLPAGRVLVKILDFGIAKLMDSETFGRLTQTGVLVGTPRYAAPEQIRDSKSVDVRTDLYAVGALLYCMLAGRPPYTTSGAQLLVDITDKEPTDPRIRVPNLRPELVAVMRRAMRKDRSYRFSSAREFAEALAPWSGVAATPSMGPSAPGEPTSATRPATPAAHALAAAPPTGSGGRVLAPTTPIVAGAGSSAASRPATPTPSPTPVRGPAIQDPTWRPTPAPPKRRSNVLLGAVLGGVVGGLLLVVAVGGVWFGMYEARQETSAASAPTAGVPAAPGTVPPACLEWSERACRCDDPDIRAQYCAYSRNVIASMRRGEVATWDCEHMRDMLGSSCPRLIPNAEARPPVVERPPTGYPACDALTHFACTCGAPGRERDLRCERANAFASQVGGLGPETSEQRESMCRREQDLFRRECDAAP